MASCDAKQMPVKMPPPPPAAARVGAARLAGTQMELVLTVISTHTELNANHECGTMAHGATLALAPTAAGGGWPAQPATADPAGS
jgi:hypothetical protein